MTKFHGQNMKKKCSVTLFWALQPVVNTCLSLPFCELGQEPTQCTLRDIKEKTEEICAPEWPAETIIPTNPATDLKTILCA